MKTPAVGSGNQPPRRSEARDDQETELITRGAAIDPGLDTGTGLHILLKSSVVQIF